MTIIIITYYIILYPFLYLCTYKSTIFLQTIQVCDIRYIAKMGFSQHINCGRVEGGLFRCVSCGKNFTDRKHLKKHRGICTLNTTVGAVSADVDLPENIGYV